MALLTAQPNLPDISKTKFSQLIWYLTIAYVDELGGELIYGEI